VQRLFNAPFFVLKKSEGLYISTENQEL